MNNLEIAELLRSVASSYQLKDAVKNKFRIIAYQRAADAIEHATSELKDLWDDGKLDEIPGIGESIASHLDELFKTGKSKHFESVMEGIPKEAFKLTELPKVGIKTAVKILSEEKPEEVKKRLKEVDVLREKNKRHLLPYASIIASEIIDYLREDSSVKDASPLGSLRRMVSTIGDIDICALSIDPIKTMNHFVKYPKSQKTIEKGEKTASILLPGDVQVDLLVASEEDYGSALQHFTGSKHHNIALREFALKKNMSLSEYGIKDIKSGKLSTFKDEKSFYAHLGLSYIPPEIREDAGEIGAAEKNKLPKLVELSDIKSDLQIHSSFDVETSHDLGASTMEDIIAKAGERGYEYIAFTEHNPSKSGHSENEIIEIIKRKKDKIDKLNQNISDVKNYSGVKTMKTRVKKVFNSLEIDIAKDGSLPVGDAGLNLLNFALVSIHSNFDLPKNEMTKRVLSALSHPKVKIFAHPSARKLNEREGVEINWAEVFEFCAKNKKFIEINADPMRLDLPDVLVRDALMLGVKFTLGTDSHHIDGLNNMIWGVSVARRGWCESHDVINCLDLKDFEEVMNI